MLDKLGSYAQKEEWEEEDDDLVNHLGLNNPSQLSLREEDNNQASSFLDKHRKNSQASADSIGSVGM